MKKLTTLFLTAFFCVCCTAHPVQAAEIEVLRGEETETEILLEGTEEASAVYGELESTTEYVLLKIDNCETDL